MPSCQGCGRQFAEGEEAWAEEWFVIDHAERVTRSETRFSCDDCHGEGS